jgi:hypothetical protein
VDLPAGRLMWPGLDEPGNAPAYWLSDEPAGADLWVRLHQAHPRSGLWPAFADGLDFDQERPWVTGEVAQPRPVGRIDSLDAGAVLEEYWTQHMDLRDGFSAMEPFGRSWPGLAPAADGRQDPDEFADQYVRDSDDGPSRVLLVPAARSADLITAVGWQGTCNYSDTPPLSAVLRSWEQRFGARVIGIGFATLFLAVASPPVTAGHAESVAAEHFAFCPDRITQEFMGTIGEYADQEVRGKSAWWFWWD